MGRQHYLNGLKAVWAVTLLSLPGFILSAPAHAQTKQTMIYEVYAGGIHALQATLTIDLEDPDTYDMNLAAKTRGLLGKLAPWHGTFESNGWAEGDGIYRPKLHRSVATWRGEEETKSYNYKRDGSFKDIVITETDKEPEIQTPDVALTDQTTDALTATLEVMQTIAAGQTCEGSSDVFDGKRRFGQNFQFKAEEDLQSSKYNIYEGIAQRCTLEIEPKGGKWYEKPRGWASIQEQGRAKGTLPTVWFGRVEEGAPAVPVKVLVKTDYGSLFMHLTEYQSANQTLIAKTRSEMVTAEQ